MSSINKNIPEDATLAVLEHPNLRREPMGAMCLPCVIMVGRSFQPFDVSPFEEVISICQENFPVNFN